MHKFLTFVGPLVKTLPTIRASVQALILWPRATFPPLKQYWMRSTILAFFRLLLILTKTSTLMQINMQNNNCLEQAFTNV